MSKNDYTDWYKTMIEKEIRPIVKLLRDNGINTVYSCGHAMCVECISISYRDLDDIVNLLYGEGYRDFNVICRTEMRYGIDSRTIRIEMEVEK